MDPETLAKLLANAQGGAPAAAPLPVPARPVPTDKEAEQIRAALAVAPDKEAYLAAWESAGWDVSLFRATIQPQAVPIPWQTPPASDPVAELAETVAAENAKPKRGRPAKVETGARFQLAIACASGGLDVAAFQAYAAEVL